MGRVGLVVLLVYAGPAPQLSAQAPDPNTPPTVATSERAAERPGDRFGFVLGPTIASDETVQDALCFFCGVKV